MASGSNAPFSGDHNDLENVQEEQHQVKGMSKSERQSFNDTINTIARNEFENNLSQLNFDGGLFTIYRDSSKIANTSNVSTKTLQKGDSIGKAILGVAGAFDISTANFNDSINTEDTAPTGLTFNNDGTKLYQADGIADKIFELNLSTPFDISTANFNQSIGSQESSPEGIAFNSDGTKLFEIGRSFGKIYESNLSTPFDISTANFNQSIGTQSTPLGIAFNNDGTKLYEVSPNTIFELNLSTPFDISTANLNQSKSVEGNGCEGIAFNSDGTKLYEIGRNNSKIFELNLSTPFDISTANLVQSTGLQDSTPTGIAFNNDGTKLFEIGTDSNNIYESDLGSGFVSNGTLTLVSKDLSLQENGGFSSPPSSAVVSQRTSIGQNENIEYTLRDGDGNTASVTQSNVDSIIDTSNFTSTIIEADVKFSQTGGTTPTSTDLMIHFKE